MIHLRLKSPLEEQLDLPTRLVDAGDSQRREREVVGQKLQPLVRRGVEVADSPQRVRIGFSRFDGSQYDGLIRAQASGLVDGMRVAPLQNDVLLGADDEERRAEGEHEEAFEIDVGSIHNVEGAGLGVDFVKDVDVVHFAVGNADKCGDIAPQVQQGVHLHGSLALSELCPREQREAQVDGGRVQRVQTLIQVHADRVADVQGPRDANQDLGEIGIDPPVARFVGVSASVERATWEQNPMW